MLKLIKPGLYTLFITVPWTIIEISKFYSQGLDIIIKTIIYFSSIFVLPVALSSIIITILINNIIKKRPNIKIWYKSGLKSFEFSIPVLIFIGGMGYFTISGDNESTIGTIIGTIIMVIITLSPIFVFAALPLALLVATISYFKNRK